MLPARSLPSPRTYWRNRWRVRRRTSGRSFKYNLRFAGQVFDGQAGLHDNYFRDYDPATGRYVQSDPVGLRGGSYSTYAYAGGNPISSIDPLGLEIGIAAHAEYEWMLDAEKKECGQCQGNDRFEVTIQHDTACASWDTTCHLAMQAAGVSHAPTHKYYSKSCLLKAGVLIKPAGLATSEAVRRGVPWVAEGLGASESIMGALGRVASVGLGPEATVLFWLPLGLIETNSKCECGAP